MRKEQVSMDDKAVEFVQRNVEESGQQILAAYSMIGALLLFGGLGFVADRVWHVGAWAILVGLVVGLLCGLWLLARSVVRH